MVEINKPTRVIHKHDTEENWLKAVNFIPKQAEIIVYDVDSTHNYERFKIGDGVTNVNKLLFADSCDSPALMYLSKTYKYLGKVVKNGYVPTVGPVSPNEFPAITVEGSNDVLWAGDGDVVDIGTADAPKYLIMLNNVWHEFNYSIDTTNSDNIFKIIDNIEGNIIELNQEVDSLRDDNNINVDYAENDETSKAYIKNRIFGDFGEDYYYDNISGGLEIIYAWFSYVNASIFPIAACGYIDPPEFSDAKVGDTIVIEYYEPEYGEGVFEGIVEEGVNEYGETVYYAGQALLFSESGYSSAFTSPVTDITNFKSSDATQPMCGLCWSDNDHNLPMALFSINTINDITVRNIFVKQAITKIHGKYTSASLSNELGQTLTISDEYGYYVVDFSKKSSVDLVVSSTCVGSIKYVTLLGVNANSRISAIRLKTQSITGVLISDIYKHADIDGNVTIQVIVTGRGVDSSWNIVGDNLPIAEDNVF